MLTAASKASDSRDIVEILLRGVAADGVVALNTRMLSVRVTADDGFLAGPFDAVDSTPVIRRLFVTYLGNA